MTRTFAAIFLFSLLQTSLACFAGAGRSISECDVEVSGPTSIYMGLVRKGLQTQTFTIEDVLWAADQKVPTSPLRNHKSIENLSVMRTLEKAVRLISREQWVAAATQMRAAIAEIKRDAIVVQRASVVTAPIYQLRPLGIFAETQTAHGNVGSEGLSIYADVDASGNTTVQRLREREIISVEGHSGRAAARNFFRTTDGKTFYASIRGSLLRVSDIDRPEHLYSFELTKNPEMSEIAKFGSQFSPIMFEMDGRLKVAVVPQSIQPSEDFGENKFAVIIDVLSGETIVRSFANRRVWYKRLGQDRLLAFGHDENFHLSILDLGKNEVIFRADWKFIGLSNLDDFAADLYLDGRGQPQMVVTQRDEHFHWLLSVTKEGPVRIAQAGVSTNQLFSHLSSFSDSSGRLWFVRMSGQGEDFYRVTIGQPGQAPKAIDVKILSAFCDIKDLKVLETRDGLKVAMWEWDMNLGVIVGIYVIDERTRRVVSLPIPSSLNLIEAGSVTYDAESNSIHAFLKAEQERWQLYQVFGPPLLGEGR